MRLRNIAKAKETLKEHPESIVLNPEQYKGKWKGRFGNNNPIFLEIGMGKGQFLKNMSLRLPLINFLGLEKYDSIIYRAFQKQSINKLSNIILLRGESENLLNYFEPNEIDRIYLNFSDPWPKKKHIKRRLTYHKFIEKYKNILVDNGTIHIKTDSKCLFEFSVMTVNNLGFFIDHIDLDLHAEEPEQNIRTEYEDSRSAGGATIYRLVCRLCKTGGWSTSRKMT